VIAVEIAERYSEKIVEIRGKHREESIKGLPAILKEKN